MTPPAGGRTLAVVRAAVIDVGSNSTLLLAVEVDGTGRTRGLDDALVTTRLGTGLRRGGLLAADAAERARAAVVELVARARRGRAATVWAFATGAVRDAADGADFARTLAVEAGIEVQILSGEAEARLAYDAIAAAFPGDGPLLAVDIGGRSTELTLGRGRDVLTVRSVPLGALTLTELAAAPDLSPADEVLAAARAATASLAASGGTATALAALDLGLTQYDPRRVHGHVMASSRLAELVRALVAMPLAQRQALPGIDPGRAAILPAGARILERITALAGVAEIQVSDHGVRHAYLRQRLAARGVEADLRDLWS